MFQLPIIDTIAQPSSDSAPANPTGAARIQTILRSADAKRRRGGVYAVLSASAVLLIWSLAQIVALNLTPATDTFVVSLAALLWLIVYGLGTAISFRTPYLFTSTFVVAFFAFHFGLLAQDGFGFIKVASYRGPAGEWATLAAWYANLAIAALGIGFATSSLTRGSDRAVSRQIALRYADANLARLRNLSVGLVVACCAFAILTFVQLGNTFQYDRFTLFFGGLDTRGIGLFNWVAPSAALGIVITARTRTQKIWSYGLGMLMFLIFAFSGNRSMALFPLLVGCVVSVKCGRRIRRLLLHSL